MSDRSKLTSQMMRVAAQRIRNGAYYICFAAIGAGDRGAAGDTLDALLTRDGYDTQGDFDFTAPGEEKQERRAAWCDKIADELEDKEYQAYLDSGHA